jgi:threonine/homoserine/homoserine lactone efflux protein
MTDPIAFTLAALALLAAPGPTNTLLATSGAAAGFARSLRLIVASALGFVISTLAVAVLFAPLAQASQTLNVVLRAACGGYLLFAAWRLWREGQGVRDEPVQFRRVLLATSLNPKALVFATMIVPHLAPLDPRAAPYLGALAGLALLVAAAWIGLGAALRNGARLDAGLARRAGALVLGVFALLVGGSAFSA